MCETSKKTEHEVSKNQMTGMDISADAADVFSPKIPSRYFFLKHAKMQIQNLVDSIHLYFIGAKEQNVCQCGWPSLRYNSKGFRVVSWKRNTISRNTLEDLCHGTSCP